MSRTRREHSFKGHAIEAAHVRDWTAQRTDHPDAPAVANELFVALLDSGADAIDLVLSPAGDRLRITATGPNPVPVRHSHGPGWRIVAGLSRSTGVTSDEHGLWAQLDGQDQTGIAGAFGYCHWCRGYASDVRLVAARDAGSGSGNDSSYACPRHRQLRKLTPLAEQ
jgi:hypothetical protein